MLEDTGFVDVQIGEGVDTFGGATGEAKARAFEVYGYAFLTHKPERDTESTPCPLKSRASTPQMKSDTTRGS
jgi:hypothetical protein